jgi:hypothetical protein
MNCISGQIPHFRSQPIADNPRPLLTILGPHLREAIVRHFIALDTQRVLDELCGPVTVVGVSIACSRRLVIAQLLALDRDVGVQVHFIVACTKYRCCNSDVTKPGRNGPPDLLAAQRQEDQK